MLHASCCMPIEFMNKNQVMNSSLDAYDGLTACGCFGLNHMTSDAIPELVRIVKPGKDHLLCVLLFFT